MKYYCQKNLPQFSPTMMTQVKLSLNKLSDQPEMLSKSYYGILKKVQ